MQSNFPDAFTFDKAGKVLINGRDWNTNDVAKGLVIYSSKEGAKQPAAVQVLTDRNYSYVTALAKDKSPIYLATNDGQIESATQCADGQKICVTHNTASCEKFRKAIGAKDDAELRQKISSCVVANMNLAFNSNKNGTGNALKAMRTLSGYEGVPKIYTNDFKDFKEFSENSNNALLSISALNMTANICLHIARPPAKPEGSPRTKENTTHSTDGAATTGGH